LILRRRERRTSESAAAALDIRLDGQQMVLVASGLGDDTGGGLFAFDGSTVERIDALSTTGLAVDGSRLYRLLYAGGVTTHGHGELLVYDHAGCSATSASTASTIRTTSAFTTAR
jgi:hypothetical protein